VLATYEVHELGLNFHGGLETVYHLQGGPEHVRRLLVQPRPVFLLVGHGYREQVRGVPFHVWGESTRFVLGANFPRERPPGEEEASEPPAERSGVEQGVGRPQ
jgi:hypothetical protein